MAAEHGILFKAEMVRAILAGIKNQTRRPITRRNSLVDGASCSEAMWAELDFDNPDVFVDAGPSPAGNTGPYLKVPRPSEGTVHRVYPRVQPGDRLWARETLYLHCHAGARGGWLYAADNAQVQLAASDPRVPEMVSWAHHKKGCTCASIHMPRWACRLVLDVPSVRCERLQAISSKDALAEGITHSTLNDPRVEYCWLWESINGPDSWSARHVWVYDCPRAQP